MKSGSKALVIVLLLAGLVLVNYLASQLPFRGDTTAGRIYTLSAGTRSILEKVEEPIVLDFYFSKDAAGLPVSYKNYAARVQEMLRQYVRASGGRLSLNIIHPKPDTPEEERAAAAGLQPQSAPGSADPVYFGLVAIQADQQKVVPSFSPQRETFLEYDLSQIVHSLQELDRPKLGLLTSLPLQATRVNPLAPVARPPEPGQFIATEWERSFDIVRIDPSADTLPEGLNALAIIHPQGVSLKLQYAVDQFILGGKPVLLAVDPASQYFKRQGGGQFGGPGTNASSDLPDLLKGYGITYDAQNVTGDLDRATPVQVSASGQVTRMPVWLTLDASALNQQALPTAQLQSLLFIEPGSFRIAEKPGVTVTKLAETSDRAGDVMAYTLTTLAPDQVERQIIPSGKRTLAALLQGKFKTAYPDGPPLVAFDANQLKESKAESTLIVIADTDWLLDDYSIRKFNYYGTPTAEPLNDNLAFGGNSLDFLAGSQDLISIRGKNSSLRPFTVVRDMEVEAQKKYQEQLVALETRISETQSKLSQLQGKATESGRLVATPEMQKAIEDFQKQEAGMRRERREIRRALREDIDALGNRLLVINLLATPLLVGAFGLWFYRARRS
ncbi:MAG: GldG family protein [Rariglobus sp.]